MEIPDRLRFPCNSCKNETWHQRLFMQNRSGDEEEEGYARWWQAQYSTWQCCGCEAVTFRIDSEDSEDREGYVTFFPQRNANLASRKLYLNIPRTLDHLYTEIIDTFNSDNRLLCAAGLRALLEGVCVNKGITEGPTADGKISKNLEGKINGLKKIIAHSIADKLHGFRFLGNAALHELEQPKRADLALAIEIIEDILNLLYELDYKTDRLYRQVQQKKKPDTPPSPSS